MKYCPRCGHELTTLEKYDRVRPYCPNCHYVAFLNPALAVGVLTTDEHQRVVLILRGEEPRRGKWGLPAGFMERDETVQDCARRECREETGLQVELDELWGVWSFLHSTHNIAGVLIIYRAHIIGGEPCAGTDSVEVKFFAVDEIPYDEIAFQTHREALKRFAASLDHTTRVPSQAEEASSPDHLIT